jgi:4-amino-4-deoxy-L-arabinose transferase-like glycosyltransferase
MTQPVPAGITAGASRARVPAWLVALLCLVAFAFQGTRGLWDPDEGRYSAGGIHMLESGNWIVPTIDGDQPHLTKPPLTYWALAASFAVFGHNEWSARLPSALAYIGTGLLVFGLGRRLCPRRPWVPPVVWGLSFGPVIAANIVSTDPLLAFFETAAMYAFVEAWSREGPAARPWYRLMWLGWGLAFMTKGPPGILPLLAMTLYLAVHERPRLRDMYEPAGLLAFAVVAFTWFGIVIAQEPARLGYFLGYEVYGRVFTAVQDRNSQWYGGLEIYLPVLLAGLLPWAAFALQAAGGVRPGWRRLRARVDARDRDWLLLLWWLLLPLAVFFLARSRLQLYVLPLLVPLALVIARPLAGWRGLDGRAGFVRIAVTAIVLLLLKGTLAHWPSNRDSRAIARAMQQQLGTLPVDEFIFVNMRPFYGLNVYLPQRIDGLELDSQRYDYSDHLTRQTLCADIARRPPTVYVLKVTHLAAFSGALEGCGFTPHRVGAVHADDNDLVLLQARAGAPAGVSR